MLNTISTLVITGVLSASAASYLVDIEEQSTIITTIYVEQAEARFQQYDALLPGVVNFADVKKP